MSATIDMGALEKMALDDMKSDDEFMREKDALMKKKYGAFLAKWGKKTVTWRSMIEWVEVGCLAAVKTLRPFIKDHETRLRALEKELAETKATPPTLADAYRGTWQPVEHQRGDVVTMSGSLWLCFRSTTTKPGAGDDWRLIVKRGADGKDLRP